MVITAKKVAGNGDNAGKRTSLRGRRKEKLRGILKILELQVGFRKPWRDSGDSRQDSGKSKGFWRLLRFRESYSFGILGKNAEWYKEERSIVKKFWGHKPIWWKRKKFKILKKIRDHQKNPEFQKKKIFLKRREKFLKCSETNFEAFRKILEHQNEFKKLLKFSGTLRKYQKCSK